MGDESERRRATGKVSDEKERRGIRNMGKEPEDGGKPSSEQQSTNRIDDDAGNDYIQTIRIAEEEVEEYEQSFEDFQVERYRESLGDGTGEFTGSFGVGRRLPANINVRPAKG